MRNGMGDEIAVLDGLQLSGLEATPVAAPLARRLPPSTSMQDGRIGRDPARPGMYSTITGRLTTSRKDVIDASEGANYSGGSSYAAGLPLLPSTVGLADADLLNYSRTTSVLPPKKNVIDPSGGANYTGGSNYVPGMPLVVSGDPGLADSGYPIIQGGYGRAGLGQGTPIIQGGYGSAGMGYWEEKYSDFAGVSLSALDAAFGSSITIDSEDDGRIGKAPARPGMYSTITGRLTTSRKDVIDASEGANYSGGSSYAAGLPLLPSTVGLAELSLVDQLDGLSDAAFMQNLAQPQRDAFKRAVGQAKLGVLKGRAVAIRKAYKNMTPQQKAQALQKLRAISLQLGRARGIRRNVLDAAKRREMAPRAMPRGVAALRRAA